MTWIIWGRVRGGGDGGITESTREFEIFTREYGVEHEDL